MEACICFPGQTGPHYVVDKDCPVHGLAMLDLDLAGMRLFKYSDGYQVLARSQKDADTMHDRMRQKS